MAAFLCEWEATLKDWAAIVCSLACLAHCVAALALPIMMGTGAWFVAEWVHLGLLAPVAVLALASLPRGYRAHRNSRPLYAGGSGVALVFLALGFPAEQELLLTMTGAALLGYAHWHNRKLTIRPATCTRGLKNAMQDG